MNFAKRIMVLFIAVSMIVSFPGAPVYARSVATDDTGTLGADDWSIDASGDIIPNTDSSLDIGETDSEVDNIYADSLWLGGVEITGASEISSPMADETGYVRTMDGGTKFKLYDAGYLHLGDNATDNDYYTLYDGSTDDWAAGLDTGTDDYIIALTAFGTDNRLLITDDANHTIITIGDGQADYDKYFVFDGAAGADYYVGIDDTGGDSEDLFVVGVGSTVGTTVAFSVDTSAVLAVTVGLDCIGAADMDYGSADVTDHTFTTDATGDTEIVLPNDSIGDAEIDWSGLTTSHGLTIGGTTPTLTVGDGAAEDNWVFFNNSAATDDWSVGVDDDRNRFEIDNGADLDQTCAISIDVSENVYFDTGDVTIADGSLTITIDETILPLVTIENTHSDGTPGQIKFVKNSASPADDDDMGRISFYSDDSGGAASEFAYILAEAQDITATKEAGSIEISIEINDTDTSFVMFQGTPGDVTTGSIDFNMDAADLDFIYDGNTTANFFTIDATTEIVTIGVATAYAGDNAAEVATTPNFQVNETADDGGIGINTWTTTATEGGGLFINTSDHATIGTHGALESGDDIGGIYWNASDGVGFQCAAAIMVEAAAQCSAGDTPGDMIFYTSADAADTPTERLRIHDAGEVVVAADLRFQTSIFATGHKTDTTTLVSTVSNLSSANLGFGIVQFVSGGAKEISIADGAVGQMVTFFMTNYEGSTITITDDQVASGVVTKTGWDDIAFDTAGDSITLLFLDATRGWIIVGNNGCTVTQ